MTECDFFQCHKGEKMKNIGALQSLPIPPIAWIYIYMNFIVGLPKTRNKSVIVVVVDHLSKYAHFYVL